MSKKTDTWMPFYVTDYLGDTMHLSTTQHGAYLLMLLACWKAGGALPNDDAQLSAITRMSLADWRKNAPVLRRFFTESGGELQHGRVIAELTKAKELSEKRSATGKKGGRPPKPKQIEGDIGTDGDTNANQTETNRFPEGKANIKQSETPSPSPSTNVDTCSLRSHRVCDADSGPEPVDPVTPTPAGAVCKLMRLQGISDGNSSNPILLELLAAGASADEFVHAARKAAGEKKGFAYALGIVRRQREEAAAMAAGLHQGPMPTTAPRRQNTNRFAGAAAVIFEDATHV